MLIQPDIHELGDKRLNPEEAVIKERNELLGIAAKKKIHGQAELENPERSGGPKMPWQEVLRRIRKCNPEIRAKDGSPGSIALYRPKRPWEYELSDFVEIPPNGLFFRDHKYVGGFEKQPMPEYAHVTLDSSHLPLREVRGWRSVLMALIKAKAVTYEKVCRQFGEPTGSRSGRWFDECYSFKQK